MSLLQITEGMLPSIEIELRKQVAKLDDPRTQPLYEMLAYHMGWTGEGNRTWIPRETYTPSFGSPHLRIL